MKARSGRSLTVKFDMSMSSPAGTYPLSPGNALAACNAALVSLAPEIARQEHCHRTETLQHLAILRLDLEAFASLMMSTEPLRNEKRKKSEIFPRLLTPLTAD